MNTGAWTAALLLLTTVAGLFADEAPGEVYHVPKYRFEIPIRVDPVRQSSIKALELYTSTDRGRAWQQSGSATPDQTSFPFAAQADGEYWFIVVVVDKQNRREPPNPMKAPVGQKIVIDTLKPDIKVNATRKNDTVNVNWEIREEHPDLNSLRLEWRPLDVPDAWVAVQASPSLLGRATIRGTEAMVVRVTIGDRAKNNSSFEVKVPSSTGIITASASANPPENVLPPSPPASPPVPSTTNVFDMDPTTPAVSTPRPPTTPLVEEIPLPKPSSTPAVEKSERVEKPERKAESAAGADVVAVTPTLSTPAASTVPPASPPSPPTLPPSVPEEKPTPEGVEKHPGDDGGIVPKLPTTPAAAPAPETEKTTPSDLQIVNNRKVSMEYEVSKVGSSGVASVDLYVTRDDGLTWKEIKAEHSAATGGESTPGIMRRQLTVELVEEGVYGFYMVVKSGAGLSLEAPKSTSQPQMRLKLDTKQPFAQLFKPAEDKKQADSLLITWEANDENLDDKPVTMEWAEKSGGPWEFIGPSQMPNSGSFSWKVPAGVPAKVFLRLTVRDKAGNVSIAETAQPQHIDFSKPVPTFKGVVIRNR